MPRKCLKISAEPEIINEVKDDIESAHDTDSDFSESEVDEKMNLIEYIVENYDIKEFISDLLEYLEINTDPECQYVKDIKAEFLELE
tara:strand:- start:1766 stop:2026 length:261 start_codon:yes stop_codon:yes gene_type:complete